VDSAQNNILHPEGVAEAPDDAIDLRDDASVGADASSTPSGWPWLWGRAVHGLRGAAEPLASPVATIRHPFGVESRSSAGDPCAADAQFVATILDGIARAAEAHA